MTDKNFISVILIEPGKEPKTVQIEDELKAMQELVGGYIEEYMPFEDDVAIICNEEGKLLNLSSNRAIYNTDGDSSIKDEAEKKIVDIIQGPFFLCYAPADSETFQSLPEDLAKKYKDRFKKPEKFIIKSGKLTALCYDPKPKEHER